MPLIRIQTSVDNIQDKDIFLSAVSNQISELTGKPEKYVMVLVDYNLPIYFSSSKEPACFVEVKSIGSLQPSLMSKQISNLIQKYLCISPDRIYINFVDIKPSMWGYNGSTFG